MNTTFGFFKSMTSSDNDNEVEIRDIIKGFNKFQVMYALQLLTIWRKKKSIYSKESKHARSGWSKKLSQSELNAVEKVHEYWTGEINQHAYYRNICGESTFQAVAPEAIEANYKALLARIWA